MWTDISPFRVNQPLGWQTMNRIRDNVFTLAAARFQHFLGGSRTIALAQGAAPKDVPNWVDVEIDSTQLTGMSVQLRVECRVATTGSVVPKLRNLTDAIDVGVGVACSASDATYASANQQQSIPVQLSPGLKKYRLMGTPSGAIDSYVIGYLEVFYPSNVVSVGSTPFLFATETVAPPLNAQVRFNAAHPYTGVTKLFVHNISGTGVNVHAALMVTLPGASVYVEDKDNHTQWARFETLDVAVDKSSYVELPVKWVANGSALGAGQEVTFYAPGAGGQALPHRATHETGGTDAITKLDAAVLQSGTLLDTRLSSNVAMRTQANHWGGWQYYDGQSEVFHDVSAPAGQKYFRVHHAGGLLQFESMNEVTGQPVGVPPLRLQFGGGAWIQGPMYVSGVRSDIQAIYPVGSIYMNASNPANPASYFGFGTWVEYGPGRAIVCYNPADAEFNAAEKIGGAKTHTLSVAEMPYHNHTQDAHAHAVYDPTHAHSIADPGHAHGVNDPTHAHGVNAHAHTLTHVFQEGVANVGRYEFQASGSGPDILGTTSGTIPNATTNSVSGSAIANYTGISIAAAGTGIGIYAAGTGIGIYNATATNQPAGGNAAHNNLQPFITAFVWKRTA